MDLEFHQVDLRYESLRTRNAAREARLLASLAETGQQAPVVVVTVGDVGRHVLVDGYKRVRALRRLGRDTVRAMAWDLGEAEALVVERLMRSGDGAGALEEGWLLAELRDRFGMTVEELGKRFDRGASWVSRRLGLVGELPREIQEQVRRGEIAAHAAMRHLVPLARANTEEAVRLAAAIRPCPAARRGGGGPGGGGAPPRGDRALPADQSGGGDPVRGVALGERGDAPAPRRGPAPLPASAGAGAAPRGPGRGRPGRGAARGPRRARRRRTPRDPSPSRGAPRQVARTRARGGRSSSRSGPR